MTIYRFNLFKYKLLYLIYLIYLIYFKMHKNYVLNKLQIVWIGQLTSIH